MGAFHKMWFSLSPAQRVAAAAPPGLVAPVRAYTSSQCPALSPGMVSRTRRCDHKAALCPVLPTMLPSAQERLSGAQLLILAVFQVDFKGLK